MRGLPLLIGAAVLAATPVAARDRAREVHPYIEVAQVLTADLDGPSDVLTYTSVAAGIDAAVRTRRVEVQASYRYEHRFSYDRRTGDEDVHSGLVRVAAKVMPSLQIEGGAIATRVRSDVGGRRAAAGRTGSVDQIYSAYAGPTLATKMGDVSVNAAYRFGYTKAEAPDIVAGGPRLDNYDASTSHMAMVSAGTRAGTLLPVGLTVSAAWEREDVSQLDQRYDGKYARADAVLPISPTVALTAGAGYEKIEVSQRDPLVDGTGAPVSDGNGRFVTDPASPRRIAYDTDGLFWDAGVVWKPSRRTTLIAKVGRRYDSMTYIGSLSYQIDRGSGIQVGVYDNVNSFGRGLTRAIAELPTAFNTRPDPFGDQFGGCVFGQEGNAAGGCLNPILAAVATAQYRSRGIDAVYSANAGPYRFGVGGGYANRRFLVPGASPGLNLNGVTDEIYYGQLFAGRSLSARSSVDVNTYLTYFDSGIPGGNDVLSGGGTGSYSYSFGRFGASASLGVFALDLKRGDGDLSAQALAGMRYSF